MHRAAPVALTAFPLQDSEIAALAHRCHVVAWSGAGCVDVETLGQARAIIVTSRFGLNGLDLDSCPLPGLVHCFGAGHDGIDLNPLKARGIRLSSGSGAHSQIVADHSMALWLATLRRVVAHDHAVRRGGWSAPDTPQRPSGRRVGLLGFGSIGRAVARRLGAFDCAIAYHARGRVAQAMELHLASALALAEWSDDVVVALPGGPTTRHLVDASFLRALGPGGHLVNVGRGSVVRTSDLIVALDEGVIAGAALDVVDDEPELPVGLRQHARVILTPHSAGMSPETRSLLLERALENLDSFFATGEPATPITPIAP